MYEKRLIDHDNGREICEMAIREGYCEILKWALENKFQLPEHPMRVAMYGGHLNIVKFLYEKGFKWCIHHCELAQSNGHAVTARWMIQSDLLTNCEIGVCNENSHDDTDGAAGW